MKFLFVYKGRYQVRDSITVEYLSSIAKQFGNETSIVYEQDVFGITDNVFYFPLLNRLISLNDRLVSKVLKEKPDFVVFLDGFNRSNWNNFINWRIKKLVNQPITVNITAIKKNSDLADYDYVLVGEPEYVFCKFFEEKVFNLKKGIYFFEGLLNLDNLPLPDKSLFSEYINFTYSYMVYTSKGCPYNCSYCEETIYKSEFGSNYFRRRSPENVILELEKAKKDFDIKEIIYKDSVFTQDKDWLKNYLALYKEKINLPYKCFGKAENFDREIANLLKKTGCYCVEFGVQTFNEEIKKQILLRTENNFALLSAFSICSEVKLRYDVDHLFGIPYESVGDHIKAAKIYTNLKYLNRIKCHNLTYYKEAPIYKFAPWFIKGNKDYQADFFSVVSGNSDMISFNKIFIKYFRILPLIPKRINLFILSKDRWRIFKFVPDLVILFLMLILAIKNRDKRFFIYIKLYSKKIIKSIIER